MSWIYLDNAATTPPFPEVLEVMSQTAREVFGNPSSSHKLGLEAAEALKRHRGTLAAVLKCRTEELVFTGGGSEADNLAIFGAAGASRRRTIVVSAVEHSAVYHSARELERRGYVMKVAPVDRQGRVDEERLVELVDDDTFLVSVMWANNEIGTIQPVKQLARAVKRKNPETLVHSDAVQALGKTPVELADGALDLVAFGAHKLHGPRGVGALWVKRGVRLVPHIFGGGQESGIRAGTENLAGIAGFAQAAVMMQKGYVRNVAHMSGLRELLWQGISQQVPYALRNGDVEGSLPNILSVSFPRVAAQNLMTFLEAERVIVSAGSACHSHTAKQSRVLDAIGVPLEHATLRLSVSHLTTQDECLKAVERLIRVLRKLRG